MARAVAEASKWVSAESAFWYAITNTNRVAIVHSQAELRIFSPEEQCRVVAQWILDATREAQENCLTSREATDALDSLDDDLDLDGVLAEVETARSLSCRDLDTAASRRLAGLARLAAYRQHAKWHDALHELIGCQTPEQAIQTIKQPLDDWIGDRWGIWIVSGEPDVGIARWTLPGPERRMLGFTGPREELETGLLPPRFRSSIELTGNPVTPQISTLKGTAEGTSTDETVGYLYAEQPFDPNFVSKWLPRLGASLAVFASRLAGRNAAEKQASQSRSAFTEAVARQDKERRTMLDKFSAGAGHEINNPLGAIAGHAARLLKDECDPKRRHALQQITAQTDRIRRMIRDLQTIGGEFSNRPDIVELSEILNDAAIEAEKQLDTGRRTFETCNPTWRVRGDRKRLARMLAEIVVNGAQAAGRDGFVNVRVVQPTDYPGDFEILVIDSGPGFPAPERHHAFIPFFSGREAGRGLGMGLPVAQRIATDHGGKISIAYSRPTTVRILLPSAE